MGRTTSGRRRIAHTRVFVALLIVLVLVLDHSWSRQSGIEYVFQLLGLALIAVSAVGRVWAAMYSSGRKRHTVVVDGPYSLVRHPLYLFTLIGAVGLGVASENIVVLALVVGVVLPYYAGIARAEEREMLERHGAVYGAY